VLCYENELNSKKLAHYNWWKPKNLRVGAILKLNIMKSYRIISVALLALLCVSLNAQLFVGGNVSFSGANSKSENGTTITQKGSNFNFDFSPFAGKFLSEKLAAGIALDFTLSGNKSGVVTETTNRSTGMGVSPFLRYYCVEWNKFSLFGQGNVGLAFTNSKVESGGVTNDGPKSTRIYFSVYPGLAYNITDNFSLETAFNIFSLGYNHLTTKNGSSKINSSGFNAGAGLSNIFTVGAISVGAIYKF
jgi:hypothetical protein